DYRWKLGRLFNFGRGRRDEPGGRRRRGAPAPTGCATRATGATASRRRGSCGTASGCGGRSNHFGRRLRSVALERCAANFNLDIRSLVVVHGIVGTTANDRGVIVINSGVIVVDHGVIYDG